MAEQNIIRRVALYSDHNGSDKVYNITLLEVEGGYLVNYENGPRSGKKLTAGTKTKDPVPLATAIKKFESLQREKMNGDSHYRIESSWERGQDHAEAPQNYTAPVASRQASGEITMLLSDFRGDEQIQQWLDDPNVVVQEKIDGEFLKIAVGADVAGSNKKAYLTGIPEGIKAELTGLGMPLCVDGECLDDHLYLFEAPRINGVDLCREPWRVRHAALSKLRVPGRFVHVLPYSGTSRAEKEAFIQEVAGRFGEGVVFIETNAPYEGGASRDKLRLKFWESATVVVLEHNATARSIVVGATHADGTMQALGSVTIPPNVPIPEIGAIVEVKYQYAFPGSHALNQSSYKGPRRDQELCDCHLGQLKYKKPLDHATYARQCAAKLKSQLEIA